MTNVEVAFITVHVDACNLNVVSWTGFVNVISKKNDFFASGNTTRKDLARGFLENELLVVSINGFLLIDGKGPSGLAGATAAKSDVIDIVDIEWSFEEATFQAFVNDFFQLIEYFASYSYYSFYYVMRGIPFINFPR